MCPQTAASGVQPKEESRLFQCWRESWLREPSSVPSATGLLTLMVGLEGRPLTGDTGWGVSRASGPRRPAPLALGCLCCLAQRAQACSHSAFCAWRVRHCTEAQAVEVRELGPGVKEPLATWCGAWYGLPRRPSGKNPAATRRRRRTV